ncbi:sulfurtransferase-like selenium metabolism protein YedF [Caminibacter mediatlanticus TB-2]|uniref:Sulfurtransferase-like selenium metabolism protein YedF n=1 Tax=Caminibacter mediatlanticus TB-2 TaxID=391592 RepID=A0ABX5VA95_9BACT|nr:sulfurtransferase-like selenium metabolism protein YedF [Caminibacter mediatlanticus]QCT95215.1 sulfurtransferase-like selenium metabolism protein YedF [Caminibacter mediatlanticus TB-2]
MKIDCRGLACPEPVIKTKRALDEINEGVIEVIVDNIASKENVKRFAENQGYSVDVKEDNGISILTIVKGYECKIVEDNSNNLLNKTLLFKDDKVGEGELGKKLLRGFLKTLLDFDKLPKTIIFINRGVFVTTKEEFSDVQEILKELNKKGVEIYSCGLCMEHFGINPKELKVGEIGNAFGTMDALLNSENTITF